MISKSYTLRILYNLWLENILVPFISIKIIKLIDIDIDIFLSPLSAYLVHLSYPSLKKNFDLSKLLWNINELKHTACYRNRVRTVVVDSILARSRDSRRAWRRPPLRASGDRSYPRGAS